jgi:class 3 adenylate cyclase
MDIGSWLRGLGLERYEQAFRENEIDEEVLPGLTADDLKDLDVVLVVIDAVGRLATQEPLNVRIGIATGLVVVGDLIGAGAAQERGVVGETPNLAARLQGLARPGAVVVAASRHCVRGPHRWSAARSSTS